MMDLFANSGLTVYIFQIILIRIKSFKVFCSVMPY